MLILGNIHFTPGFKGTDWLLKGSRLPEPSHAAPVRKEPVEKTEDGEETPESRREARVAANREAREERSERREAAREARSERRVDVEV